MCFFFVTLILQFVFILYAPIASSHDELFPWVIFFQPLLVRGKHLTSLPTRQEIMLVQYPTAYFVRLASLLARQEIILAQYPKAYSVQFSEVLLPKIFVTVHASYICS